MLSGTEVTPGIGGMMDSIPEVVKGVSILVIAWAVIGLIRKLIEKRWPIAYLWKKWKNR